VYSIEVLGLAAVRERVRNVPKQMRYAAALALGEVGRAARADLAAEARTAFKDPTPFTIRALLSRPRDRWATTDRLVEIITPEYPGGKAVDPVDVLRPEVEGGARKLKRAERAFQRVGILPPGMAMVPARGLVDGPKGDGYGNVKGSFIVQLISYFQAFGEQGYRANMTAKRKRSLAKYGKSEGGFKRIGGVEYFVSRGRGEFTGRGSWRNGQQQHLPAGIWQRSGTHGSNVKPVFLFVRPPRYTERFRMGEVIAQRARDLPQRFNQHLVRALATAR